jgi:hypothetical protein
VGEAGCITSYLPHLGGYGRAGKDAPRRWGEGQDSVATDNRLQRGERGTDRTLRIELDFRVAQDRQGLKSKCMSCDGCLCELSDRATLDGRTS